VSALEAGAQMPLDPLVEWVIPVHNEELALPGAVERLTTALDRLPYRWQVTIADNASTDATSLIARQLARQYDGVSVVSMAEKGRGRALKHVWSSSGADVVAYMDVDLSTDLNAILPLVAPLLSGHSDIAIGSRLHRSARVVRGPKREFVSRSYNVLLRGTLRTRFSDAQCGFKAVRREVADALLPLVEDDTWFFDTELLVLAERSGLRIHEVPVDWIDDPDSRVDVLRTALDDLRGIRRMAWALLAGQLPLAEVRAQLDVRARSGRLGNQVGLFALVGLASTLAYALLFLVFRQVMPAQGANLLALAATAIGNTAANRHLTFGVRGREGLLAHHGQGLLVFALGLGITSGSLALLQATGGDNHPVVEIGVLTVANLVVTVLRFVAMRLWIFRQRSDVSTPTKGRVDADEATCRR